MSAYKTIGFIGLGVMGEPICRNLVKKSGARVDFDPANSDADFLVEFRTDRRHDPLEQFFGLAFALEETLGRRVDLVESGAPKNPFVLASIERDRATVYES